MLLERNQALVGLIAAIVIAAGTVFAVGLSAGAFVSGYPVAVEFENAAGIIPGDHVLVAGVRAGEVTDVRIADGLIVVEVHTTAGLPVDSSAAIVNKNLLGARAVELTAGREWERLLEDEALATIPVERTTVPVDVPELGDATVELLQDADATALTELVTTLADVTEGQRDEIGRLLDGLGEVGEFVAEDRESLVSLITNARIVVDAVEDRDDDLVRTIDAFGSTVDELAARRERIRSLLTGTRDAARLSGDLLRDHRAELDRVLREADALVAIVDRHQVDLAHAVAYGGVAFSGFASVGRSGPADNPSWGNILTSGAGMAGIDAFAGCGGVLDQILDRVLGPAECPELEPGAGGSGPAERGPPPGTSASLRRVFAVPHAGTHR
ncbi:MAG: MCE family protein [Actinobacteria bacterium]|nr:MCE family protein [Actinomycetota bacterium]